MKIVVLHTFALVLYSLFFIQGPVEGGHASSAPGLQDTQIGTLAIGLCWFTPGFHLARNSFFYGTNSVASGFT